MLSDIRRNLTMLTDFYELTMGNGYHCHNMQSRNAVFDMFFRNVPDGGGFAIVAGLEQLIQYLSNIKFTPEDIDYLRSKGQFSEDFLAYLENFEFCCDVWAIKEGTPVFPYEPIVTVRGPLIQAQFVETMVLLTINHQSLIATKANRIVRAAQGRGVFEFGSRRAQSYDGAVLGARAAYIGGCHGTSCAITDRLYSIPAVGTMAHSWVQAFDDEYEAFCNYAKIYPDRCTLLVDTYNTIKSGIPNAIRTFNDVVLPAGHRPKAVRIDSGDIAYLSKKARTMLDNAGFSDVQIMASNSLDEHIIRDLILQGAKIDSFGVGESLITSKSSPVFGGVYKMVAIEDSNGVMMPRIKISESIEKITTPAQKNLYRVVSRDTGKALADYVTEYGEEIDTTKPLEIFDPISTWKKQRIENFELVPLLTPIFEGGKLVYNTPEISHIRNYCTEQIDLLWEEVNRFENPHKYYVDLSKKLWDTRRNLLEKNSVEL